MTQELLSCSMAFQSLKYSGQQSVSGQPGSLTDKLKAVFSPDLVNKIEKVITFVNWDVDI